MSDLLLSGTNSICAGIQWTVGGINLCTAGVGAGAHLKVSYDSKLLGITYGSLFESDLWSPNGVLIDTGFVMTGMDFTSLPIVEGVTQIHLSAPVAGDLGLLTIVEVVDATHLTIESTGVTESGVGWELTVRDEETWEGFEVLGLNSTSNLSIEQSVLSASSLDYEIWGVYIDYPANLDAPVLTASDGLYEDHVSITVSNIDEAASRIDLYKNTENNFATADLVGDVFVDSQYDDYDIELGQTYYYWGRAISNICSSSTTGIVETGYTYADVYNPTIARQMAERNNKIIGGKQTVY